LTQRKSAFLISDNQRGKIARSNIIGIALVIDKNIAATSQYSLPNTLLLFFAQGMDKEARLSGGTERRKPEGHTDIGTTRSFSRRDAPRKLIFF